MTHAYYKNLFFLSKLHLVGRIFKTLVFEACWMVVGGKRRMPRRRWQLSAQQVCCCAFSSGSCSSCCGPTAFLQHAKVFSLWLNFTHLGKRQIIVDSMCSVCPLLHLAQVGGEILTPAFFCKGWGWAWACTQPSFWKPRSDPKVDLSVPFFSVAPQILASKLKLCPTCSRGLGTNLWMPVEKRLIEPVI